MKHITKLIVVLAFSTSSLFAQQIGDGFSPVITDFTTHLKSGTYTANKPIGGVSDISLIDGWQHLLVVRHATSTNNFQLQIASSMGTNDKIFFRKIADYGLNSQNPTWNEIATRGANQFIGNQTVAGLISISEYSPTLILKRNTTSGSFTQGIQTKLLDGTNNWFYGALNTGQWIVSKGDYQNPKLMVLESGDVGIGTTIPSSKLHVAGATQITDGIAGADTARYATFGVTRNNDTSSRAYIAMTRAGSVVKAMGINGSNTWLFGQPDSAQNISLAQMAITQAGNVGIGTTTPDEKLTVNGTIHAKEVRVDMLGWPDYVFENTYNLKPLASIEQYIKEKGHLPNVPSATEIEEKGLELSKMSKIQQEKIEELTLYLIQQNKEIEELKAQVKAILAKK